jgi:hypothetical protein
MVAHPIALASSIITTKRQKDAKIGGAINLTLFLESKTVKRKRVDYLYCSASSL